MKEGSRGGPGRNRHKTGPVRKDEGRTDKGNWDEREMKEIREGEEERIRQRRAPLQRNWRRNEMDMTGQIRNPKSQMEHKSGHGEGATQENTKRDRDEMEEKMTKEVGSGGVELEGDEKVNEKIKGKSRSHLRVSLI